MSKAGERLIAAAKEAKDTCWLCLNSGRIVDLSSDGKTPGPDHDKPCPCGRAE